MKYIKYFLAISIHRWVVFIECVACGIWWQGLVHDISKFSITEFISSAKYFYGNDIEQNNKPLTKYEIAWLHHKSCNKHHWEYWCYFDERGKNRPVKIPRKYVIEMICDWIGAGKVYSKDQWTQDEPLNYFYKHRNSQHYDLITGIDIEMLLLIISEKGLKEFHKQARLYLKDEKRLNHNIFEGGNYGR